jgi:predicted enzyme involved in methoxymalonyl-ACP biosynthesis
MIGQNIMSTNTDKGIFLKKIKESIKVGQYQDAFAMLCSISDPADDFVLQVKYAAFCKNIVSGLKELKPVRVAVVATSTVTHFNDVLTFWLAKEGILAEIYEAEYSTLHQIILDPQSPLYTFKPEVVMLFTNYRDFILDVPLGSTAEMVKGAITSAVDDLMSLGRILKERLNCRVIVNNADLPYQRILGNYECTAPYGLINMLRQFNSELARCEEPGTTILDMDFLSSVYGKRQWHEARFWYHSKHAFALDATGLVAQQTAKIIGAGKGLAKKCVVLDLDNTLWGGTIGDDGLDGIQLGNGPAGEAFVDFQKFLLKLKERGILLTVCSKNENDAAREPFVKHPEGYTCF